MLRPVGTPALWGDCANPDRIGYVAEVKAARGNVFTLGGGGMTPEAGRYVIAWDNATFSEVGDSIAVPWFARAERARVEGVTEARALEMLAEARKAQAEHLARADAERKAEAERVEAWRNEYRDQIPTDAKAVIVAELQHDECDTMTDYFSVRTSRVVLLAFSRHTRDLFPEMRKAAARFTETAALEHAPENAEHREKYSMGSGFYLKGGNKYSDGWAIRKRRLASYSGNNDPAAALPVGEWMIPAGDPYVTGAKPERREQLADDGGAENLPAETVNGCIITPCTHSKKGFRMWIVQIPERVERETFNALLQTAKAARGWYSRKWGSTPAGFAFKDADRARAFAGEVSAHV